MAVKASAQVTILDVSDGNVGTGIESIVEEYCLSESQTIRPQTFLLVDSSTELSVDQANTELYATSGEWSENVPTWEDGMYLWKRYRITYKDPRRVEYTNPLVDYSWVIEIGGRNLAEKTNQGKTGWNWSMKTGDVTYSDFDVVNSKFCSMTRGQEEQTGWSVITYEYIGVNKFEAGRKYVISFDVIPSVNTHFLINLRNSDGSGQLNKKSVRTKDLIANKTNRVSVVLELNGELPEERNQVLYLTEMDSSQLVSYQIGNLMIETGNKPTQWTPAPEDTKSDIDHAQQDANSANAKAEDAQNAANNASTKADKAQNAADEAKSQLDNLANDNRDIRNNVQDLTQTLAGQNAKIDANGDKLKDLMGYIQISNGQITLGATGSKIKMEITNSEIRIKDGGQVTSFFGNQSMQINYAGVVAALTIGQDKNWQWAERDVVSSNKKHLTLFYVE